MRTWKELDSISPDSIRSKSQDLYDIFKICQIYLEEKKLSKEFDQFSMQLCNPETRKNKIKFEEKL